MTRRSHLVAVGLCSLWVLLPGARAGDLSGAGPLYDRFSLTLTPGERVEAMGPFFYSEKQETQRTWALPPLFSRFDDPAVEAIEYDVLYPLLSFDHYGTEYRWHFCQLLSTSGGHTYGETPKDRFTLFPIYFQQRSPDPDLNYTALFPFYGHLKNRLLRDEIFFAMFPLYARTRKREVITENYVYPFVHVRRGGGVEGWQFWPFYGREHKDVTTRTNGFGELEAIGGHDRRFAFWPFYVEQRSGIGTENPEDHRALLPFYSLQRSPARDSTTVIWPLLSHVTDRQKQYREWQTPWPLIVFARGEGKTTSRVWPFFGRAHNAYLQSDFYLWPVYKYNRLQAGALERERTRILLFLYSDITQKNTATGAEQRRVDLWPLFTQRRDYGGRTRLQVLSILEPILPQSKSIERNYSPLWAVWRAEKNPETRASSQSLLWNLYRRDTSPDARKCSLLFGLFQYQSGSDGKRLRLLYIPVVKTRAEDTTRPE